MWIKQRVNQAKAGNVNNIIFAKEYVVIFVPWRSTSQVKACVSFLTLACNPIPPLFADKKGLGRISRPLKNIILPSKGCSSTFKYIGMFWNRFTEDAWKALVGLVEQLWVVLVCTYTCSFVICWSLCGTFKSVLSLAVDIKRVQYPNMIILPNKGWMLTKSYPQMALPPPTASLSFSAPFLAFKAIRRVKGTVLSSKGQIKSIYLLTDAHVPLPSLKRT